MPDMNEPSGTGKSDTFGQLIVNNQRIRMARRPDLALAGISLRQRRAWFADDAAPTDDKPEGEGEKKKPDPAKPDGSNGQDDDELPDWMGDKKRVQAELKKLRSEAAANRKLANELKTWREQQEAEAQTRAEKELRDKQEFEKLANQYKTQLEQVQAQAKAAELRALRTKIGAEFSLPAPLIDRLIGDDEETIRKDAESLKSTLGTPDGGQDKDKGKGQPGRDRRSTTPMPGGQPGETDEQKKARLLNRGTRGTFGSGAVKRYDE